jgi:hypothetical protein
MIQMAAADHQLRRQPLSYRAKCAAVLPSSLAVPADALSQEKKGSHWLPSSLNLERETSLELATSTLARLRSTN